MLVAGSWEVVLAHVRILTGETLDLAGGGRRSNRGEQVADPVLAADPYERRDGNAG
jgi:hypothetical protein